MRNNGIFVILALAFVITISAIGEEDSPLTPPIDLAVEPITVPIEPNISRAALRNDFLTFDRLYKTADDRGADIARWSELHRFWTWSMTDPLGGFYDQVQHDRFARTYPDYASYIADYKIIDSNGNAFYPSAETRRFLIANVVAAPRPLPVIAEAPRVVPASRRPLAPKAAETAALHAPVLTAAPAPDPVEVAVEAPREASVRVVAPAPTPATPVPVRTAARPGVGRGILLIIVGLIGIGVITVMLHAPGDEPRNPHPGIT